MESVWSTGFKDLTIKITNHITSNTADLFKRSQQIKISKINLLVEQHVAWYSLCLNWLNKSYCRLRIFRYFLIHQLFLLLQLCKWKLLFCFQSCKSKATENSAGKLLIRSFSYDAPGFTAVPLNKVKRLVIDKVWLVEFSHAMVFGRLQFQSRNVFTWCLLLILIFLPVTYKENTI